MTLYLGSPRNQPMELLFGDGWLKQHVARIWGFSIGTVFIGWFWIDKTHVDHTKDPRGTITTPKRK